jgi:hypothetical protein
VHDLRVRPEPRIHREELTATLFAIADINANVERIVELLEGGDDGEEEPAKEDS